MASGMSAAIVSRIGLPLSMVSTEASTCRFSCMRSAILFRISARFAGAVAPQASFALCAASSASSMSPAWERATWQIGLPVIGLILSKYLPSTGGTHLPPMKLS